MQIFMTDTKKAIEEVVFLHGILMLLGMLFFPASNPVENCLIESTRIYQWKQSVFFIELFFFFFVT